MIVFKCVEDGIPVISVGAVDAGGSESGFFGGGDLIAHECEQWRDDEGGAVSGMSESGGSGPVDGAFAPAGCLYNEHSSNRLQDGVDGIELIAAWCRGGSGEFVEYCGEVSFSGI